VFTEQSAYGVSVGVLLGGVAQLGMQLPSLFKLGFRFQWRLALNDPRMRELWALMWPSLIAGAAVQLNVMINGVFASEINGGRSWLSCAFRLMQLPIGLFGVSVATVTLPAVARRFARDDLGAFGRTVRSSMRLTLFLSMPAAAGLAALAAPVIALIYQHGRFTANDTYQTSLALQAYSLGLAGYAGIRVLTPCFYALNLPRTPLRVNLIGIAVVLTLNLLNMLVFHLGHAGLALATSLVVLLNVGQLSHALSRQVDFGALREWANFVGRVLIAAIACAATAWALNTWLDQHLNGRLLQSLGLVAAIIVSLGVYAGAGFALRIRETGEAFNLVRRRFIRRRA
jgi:putative peptidoglycan lipid II flippase